MTCCTIHTDVFLRRLQVSLYVMTVIAGLMTSISLGWATRTLSMCPLYSNVVLMKAGNNTLELRPESTWGRMVRCDYCTYTAVMAAIYAITWFWFYFLVSDFRDNDSEPSQKVPPDTRLLLPSLVLNVLLFVCCFVVACMISDGFSDFCIGISTSLRSACSEAGKYPWIFPKDGQKCYGYLQVASAGAWILAATLGGKIVVVGVRIYRFTHQVSPTGSFSLASVSQTPRNSVGDDRSLSSDEEQDLADHGKGFDNLNYNTMGPTSVDPSVDMGKKLSTSDEQATSEEPHGPRSNKETEFHS